MAGLPAWLDADEDDEGAEEVGWVLGARDTARERGTAYSKLYLDRVVGDPPGVATTRTQALIVLLREDGFLLAVPPGAFPAEALDRGNTVGDQELGANVQLEGISNQGVRGQRLRTSGPVVMVDVQRGGDIEDCLRPFENLDPAWGAPTDFGFGRWPHGSDCVTRAIAWIQGLDDDNMIVSAYETDVAAWTTAQETGEGDEELHGAAPEGPPEPADLPPRRGRAGRGPPPRPKVAAGREQRPALVGEDRPRRGVAPRARGRGTRTPVPSEDSWEHLAAERGGPPAGWGGARPPQGRARQGGVFDGAPMFGQVDLGQLARGQAGAAMLEAITGGPPPGPEVRQRRAPRAEAAADARRGVGDELDEPELDPLVRLADLLTERRGAGEDPTLLGLDVAPGTSSASVRGAAARERIMDQLRLRPGSLSADVAENMQRRLGRTPRPGEPPEPLVYLERFGSFADSRDLGLVAWTVATALEHVWRSDQQRASDSLAMLLVSLEQAALDRGSWDLAWLMTFQEDPPEQVFARLGQSALPRSFAPLARQHWATANMAFLRELDTLQTRRQELRRGQFWRPRWRRDRPGDADGQGQGEEQADAGKGEKAKGKKKGKEKAE